MTERIRPAAVAGSFYPASPERLRRTVEALLAQANPPAFRGKLRGLIVPHAGYIYSGPVAATGYKIVQSLLRSPADESASSLGVLLLGPAHYVYFVGAATLDVDAWQTPLGLVKSSQELITRALKHGDLLDNPEAHAPEHSLEVQLPFLQVVLPHCAVFPVLTGECDYRELARVLSSYLDELDLVIVSSDLSHYYPYDEAVQRDALSPSRYRAARYTLDGRSRRSLREDGDSDADGDRSRAQLAREAPRLSQFWGHSGG
jgi:AmmeMemoRadiSam system protein B